MINLIRKVGLAEGVSYLLLLGIAMPLKYFADMPEFVTVIGTAHGVLFVAYACVVFVAWGKGVIGFGTVLLCAIASLLPFGPFLIDRKIKSLKGEPTV